MEMEAKFIMLKSEENSMMADFVTPSAKIIIIDIEGVCASTFRKLRRF